MANRWPTPRLFRLRSREFATRDMRHDLVAALFDEVTQLAVLAVAFVAVGAVITSTTPDAFLLAVYLLGSVSALAPVAIVCAYRAKERAGPGRPPSAPWETIYALGLFAFAACLGAVAARVGVVATDGGRILAIALLFGFGSGVVARVSSRPGIALPSLSVSMLPAALAFALQGELEDVAMGGVIAAFAFGSAESVLGQHQRMIGHLRARRHLAGLARQDALTGLPNRLEIEERLSIELRRLGRRGGIAALHYLDLDGFKAVNDSFGHRTGDLLLKAFALRLSGLLRAGDVAGRLGGDEFIVVQAGCAQRGEAELLARRISKAVALPFLLDGREVTVGTSVGVAIATAEGPAPQAWLAAADAALYRAKARGRNRVVMAEDADEAIAS